MPANPRAASIPSMNDPKPEPRKAPLPNPVDKNEPRRAADPFARKSTGGGSEWQPAATPGAVKAWRRARSGLWWVGAALFLFLIPAIVLPGLAIADHFAHHAKRTAMNTKIAEKLEERKKAAKDDKPTAELDKEINAQRDERDKLDFIPDGEFPVLKISQRTAIPLLIAAVPILLGLLCLLIGRLGFTNVPRRSCAKGPALLATLATILTLAGAVGLCFPNVAFLFSQPEKPIVQAPNNPGGQPADTAEAPPPNLVGEGMPVHMFGREDPAGLIQRFGILIGLASLVVGEFWFASAVGRVGAALSHESTAARATRYSMLVGIAVIVTVAVGGVLATDFGFGSGAHELSKESSEEVISLWKRVLNPVFNQMGEFRPILKPAVILLGTLFLGLIYYRLIRAPRRAIADWLARNAA
jgi:hypothetical protein